MSFLAFQEAIQAGIAGQKPGSEPAAGKRPIQKGTVRSTARPKILSASAAAGANRCPAATCKTMMGKATLRLLAR